MTHFDQTRFARVCLILAALAFVTSFVLPSVYFDSRPLLGVQAAILGAELLPLSLALAPALEDGGGLAGKLLGLYLWLLLLLDVWLIWALASALLGHRDSQPEWSRRLSLLAPFMPAPIPWLPWSRALGPLGWEDADIVPAAGFAAWLGAFALAAIAFHLEARGVRRGGE